MTAQTKRPQLSQYGCDVTADQALTARALATEKIERAAASRILAIMYPTQSDNGGPLDRLREEVIDLAYRSDSHPLKMQEYVRDTCYAGKGKVDALFGMPI